VLILLLIFFLVFSNQVLATPSVNINSASEIITAGTTFPVTFTINEASSSATYCYKFFGGIDNDVYAITSDSSLSYTSGWIHFPQITLDPNGPNIFNGYAYVKSDTPTSNLNLKIKIALTTNTSIGATSLPLIIDVVAAPPTPTPTSIPTNTPTSTPTPTKTPTPTPTSTSTPTPTAIISQDSISTTPFYNGSTVNIETPTSTIESILGETTTLETTSKKNFLPLILIIGGGVLLLCPLIITKIKKQ